jgi:uncharacterized membrane protein
MLQLIKRDELLPKLASLLLAVIFTAVFFWLNSRQYRTFQLRAPDIAHFDQAIWNTLHGRFLFTTITGKSILEFHFTPYMALLSPLLLIWSDVRVLFLAQLVGIAVSGLLLYKIVEDKHPLLAPIFLLAFYLNPMLHQVTLLELRRVTLAMPFVALALYGLYKDKRWLMLIGLGLALLVKEDMGLIVAMIGLYLTLVKRDLKWGIPIAVFGIAWTFSMLLWIIPSLTEGDYRQLNYFEDWGGSLGEIILNMVTHPLQVLQVMFDQQSLRGLWLSLLPVALVLPFLAFDVFLIGLPAVAVMLLSSDQSMHSLDRWYMAPVIPVIYAAVAVGLTRLNRRHARWATVVLLGATIIAYIAYSQAPLGGRFEPYRYRLTERHAATWELLEAVPDEAKVASQVAFLAALSQREDVYMYPWISIGEENVDYFVLGRDFAAYPLQIDEIGWEIENMVADPDLIVDMEANGVYLLRNGGEPLPSFPVNRIAEEAIKLDRFEIAVADEMGVFRVVDEEPLTVWPGQQLRVTLYWEAIDAPEAERTVSVRVEDETGALVAQKDVMPSNGARPTSWWQPGWNFRDVYYLTIGPTAAPGPATLDVLLYDTFTQERVPFEGGEEVLHLFQLELVSQNPEQKVEG